MKTIILRLLLVLIALGAIGFAGYHVYTQEARAGATRQALQQFEDDAARLQVALVDLRASQAAYLVPGQDPAVWASRSAALLRDANARVARLAAGAAAADAEGDLAAAAESLATLERFDGRIRELLQDAQPLTAASLIFSDCAELMVSASTAVARARGAAATRAGGDLAALQRQELYAIGAACGIAAVVLLLLVPGWGRESARQAPTEVAERSAGVDSTRRDPLSDLALQDLDSLSGIVRRAEPVPALAVTPPSAPPVPATPAPRAVAPPPDVRVDLVAAARLCSDLARVVDTGELPGLLARAAAVLNASGIVVWMGGTTGDLWPAFSYGYSPQALARMQSLPREGETAVSVAFRKGSTEVVPAEHEFSGAIVAPIVTSSRCVGVMAVEMPPGAETDAGEQALSNIIAAQLATLVAGETAP